MPVRVKKTRQNKDWSFGSDSIRTEALGFALSLGRRAEAERHPRPDRGLGLGRFEIRPTARRELVLFPDHAGRDAVDVGNVGAAKTKRIVGAGLLLLGRVGLARSRPHRNRERGYQHQNELEIPGPDNKHDSPKIAKLQSLGEWQEIGKGLASSGERPLSACVGKATAGYDIECGDFDLRGCRRRPEARSG